MSDDEEISVYDEVEIEDMTYDDALQTYFYPCPCGDRFQIALADLQDEETDIAVCPSCSLRIRVIYEVVSSLHRFSWSFKYTTPHPFNKSCHCARDKAEGRQSKGTHTYVARARKKKTPSKIGSRLFQISACVRPLG